MQLYILFDSNTQDGLLYKPLATVFETREAALLALFGPIGDYFDGDEEIENHTLWNYLSDMIYHYDRDGLLEDYDRGDYNSERKISYKSVFMLDTETKTTEIIV